MRTDTKKALLVTGAVGALALLLRGGSSGGSDDGGDDGGGLGNVTITLYAYNAPVNAVYWTAVGGSKVWSDYAPIGQGIVFANTPASTPQDGIVAVAFGSGYEVLVTPNNSQPVGFAKPFVNGGIYYWNFSLGILLDSNHGWM